MHNILSQAHSTCYAAVRMQVPVPRDAASRQPWSWKGAPTCSKYYTVRINQGKVKYCQGIGHGEGDNWTFCCWNCTFTLTECREIL